MQLAATVAWAMAEPRPRTRLMPARPPRRLFGGSGVTGRAGGRDSPSSKRKRSGGLRGRHRDRVDGILAPSPAPLRGPRGRGTRRLREAPALPPRARRGARGVAGCCSRPVAPRRGDGFGRRGTDAGAPRRASGWAPYVQGFETRLGWEKSTLSRRLKRLGELGLVLAAASCWSRRSRPSASKRCVTAATPLRPRSAPPHTGRRSWRSRSRCHDGLHRLLLVQGRCRALDGPRERGVAPRLPRQARRARRHRPRGAAFTACRTWRGRPSRRSRTGLSSSRTRTRGRGASLRWTGIATPYPG